MAVLNAGQIEIINTTIKLAKEKRKEHEALNSNRSGQNLNKYTRRPYDNAEQCLKDFLEMLDIQMIKVIRTVMYIGKEEIEDYSINGKDLYRHYFNSTSLDSMYRDELIKDVEIDRITQKMILDEFLINGSKILSLQYQSIL